MASLDPPSSSLAGRRTLGQWLRTLGNIGGMLVVVISGIAHRRRHQGEAAHVDIDCAWSLIARAMLWMKALRARFRTEAAAAAVEREPRESLYDGPEHLLTRARDPSGPMPDCGDCIAGKSVAEVLAQICTDLSAAATLLGMTEQAATIAVIHEAVSNVLARLANAEGPQAGVELAAIPAAAIPVRPLDSG